MKTDKFGIELKIGASVVYTKGQRGDYRFYTGMVLKFDERYCCIKTNDTKREIIRHYDSVISIEPLKITNPEVFI